MREELERRARFRAAVGSAFEVTTSNKDRLRKMEVVNVVAGILGHKVVDSHFCLLVFRAAEELGAEPVKPQNKSMYRKMRRRA